MKTTRASLLSRNLLVLLGLLWLVGCSPSDQAEKPKGNAHDDTSSSAESRPITIGAVLCLTGSGAEYGKDAERGIMLAVDELNSQGGISGRRVRVLVEDDQTQPRVAVSAAEKLISVNDVKVIIGAVTSSSHLAIAPIADREQVVIISPGASNPSITDAGDFVFRNWISDELEGSRMAEYVYSQGVRSAAVLYINNDYGVGLKDVFTRRFGELGGKLPVIESYEQDATDFRTQLTKIASSHPDIIYLPGYYKELAGILNQSVELGIKIPMRSVVCFEDPKLLELAGKNAEGVIYSSPYFDPEAADTLVRAFVNAFKRRYDRIPGIFAAHAYDATRIIADAIRNSGYSGPQIRDALYHVKDYPGVSGATTFDQNGDVVKKVAIKTVRNGQFVFVD